MAKQPVTINGIAFDALIEQTDSFSANVPTYPVESGFVVTDAIIANPLELSMTLYLTNTPVTWRARHGGNPSRVVEVTQRLREMFFKKSPVTIVTSEKTYSNMAIVSMSLSKSLEVGTSREIPITFQEIRMTSAKSASLPSGYGPTQNAGSASVTKSSSSSSGSGGTVFLSVQNATNNANKAVFFDWSGSAK